MAGDEDAAVGGFIQAGGNLGERPGEVPPPQLGAVHIQGIEQDAGQAYRAYGRGKGQDMALLRDHKFIALAKSGFIQGGLPQHLPASTHPSHH